MSASSSVHPRRRSALPALAAVLSLTLCAVANPVAAGGLNDFLKKGGGGGSSPSGSGSSDSNKSSGSSNSGSRDSDRGSSNSDRNSNSSVNIWHKGDRQENTSQPAPRTNSQPPARYGSSSGGSLFDLFNKRRDAEAAPVSRPLPQGPQPGASRPATPPTAGGGLFDLFRKPMRTPTARPFGSHVPPTVVYHFYDPWYYPYDRYFYDYYRPYIIRDCEIRWGVATYYDAIPDEDRDEERAVRVLRDIEKGWEQESFTIISRYVDGDGTIAVYNDGQYSHTMNAREFRAMTLKAFEDTRTVRFRFLDSRLVHADEMRAEGEHVFVGPDGEERRVEVTYTLRKPGRRWLIDSIDLRHQQQYGALAPVAPQGPAISLALAETNVAIADVDLSGPAWGVFSRGALAEPYVPGPPFVAAGEPGIAVAAAEETPLALDACEGMAVATSEPPRAKAPRVVCTATPIRPAALRSAKKPLQAATVTYWDEAGSMATYQILLSPANDGGIKWRVAHRGEPSARDAGALPAAKVKALPAGSLRLEAGRSKTPNPLAPGEKCESLFTHPSWDFQVLLVGSPKAPASKPIRTEILIDNEQQG